LGVPLWIGINVRGREGERRRGAILGNGFQL